MSSSKQEWLNQRAYALWEENGREDGRDAEHWLQAISDYERLEANRASSDGEDIMLKLRTQREEAPEGVEIDTGFMAQAAE